ncbi:hypothetical protein [Streptacidiphilus sp. MAP5-3]|jgi:hypothetical protein|uniref:hypothetical protein n=1 Tax=unclassified Streptacidiphilus TaxID=2643834 RepID=UPI0035134BD0
MLKLAKARHAIALTAAALAIAGSTAATAVSLAMPAEATTVAGHVKPACVFCFTHANPNGDTGWGN